MADKQETNKTDRPAGEGQRKAVVSGSHVAVTISRI